MATLRVKPVSWDEIPEYGLPPDSYMALLERTRKIVNWDEYRNQVVQSDGFYVDPKASNNICFGITPHQFDPYDGTDLCLNLTTFAVDTFNRNRLSFQDPHGKLEFIALLNATSQAHNGFRFYLTFEAKNLDTGITSNYQAIVWKDSARSRPPIKNPEVLAFRLKPTPGSIETWFWSDRQLSGRRESGEGVSKVPEPPIDKILEEFVVDDIVGCSVFDDCMAKHIRGFIGASFCLRECESDPSKTIIELSGTVEQLKKARPFMRERIRQFQNYHNGGDFETMRNHRCRMPWENFEE